MARTNQEMLDDLDAAIKKIEDGAQQVFIGDGKSYMRGSLTAMYAERKTLQARVNRGAGGAIPVRRATPFVSGR